MTERFGHRRTGDLGRWSASVKIDRTVRSSNNRERGRGRSPDYRRVAEGEWLTCRVGKGASMVLNTSERLSCAVPTSGVKSRRHDLWWARRTQGFPPLPSGATAFAHPTSDDVATRYFAASASSL